MKTQNTTLRQREKKKYNGIAIFILKSSHGYDEFTNLADHNHAMKT